MNGMPMNGMPKTWSVLRDEWRVRFTLYAMWYALLAWAHARGRRKDNQRPSRKYLQIGTFWRG